MTITERPFCNGRDVAWIAPARMARRKLVFDSMVNPKRRSRQQERKEETRRELVEAAARVFARRGFHGASIEQIASEAGYSTGAVYWHFKGKDDLFLAVYEAQATARARAIEHFGEDLDGDLPQRARGYADKFMVRLDQDPDFLILTLEFLIHAWRNPTLRGEFSDRLAWGRDATERLLADAGSALPMAAGDLASVLRELGTGLGLARLADPDAIPSSLYGDFVQLLFQLIAERGEDELAAIGVHLMRSADIAQTLRAAAEQSPHER